MSEPEAITLKIAEKAPGALVFAEPPMIFLHSMKRIIKMGV